MGQALAKSHGTQFARGAVEGIAASGEFERDRNVFQRGHRADEVEGLEDDADARTAEPGEFVLA